MEKSIQAGKQKNSYTVIHIYRLKLIQSESLNVDWETLISNNNALEFTTRHAVLYIKRMADELLVLIRD